LSKPHFWIAFLENIAPQRIPRHPGEIEAQVHIHPTDADSRLKSRRQLCSARHLRQPGKNPKLSVPKLSICRPDMHILIHPLHVQNLSTSDTTADDRQHDTDFDPDPLTDKEIFSG
jgi:hypothetical protein